MKRSYTKQAAATLGAAALLLAPQALAQSANSSASSSSSNAPWLYRQPSPTFCKPNSWNFDDNKLPAGFVLADYTNVTFKNGVMDIGMYPTKENASVGLAGRVSLDGFYFQYGVITARLRTDVESGALQYMTLIANGTADGRDEIDWEYVGCNGNQAESNIFANDHVIFQKYGGVHAVSDRSVFHNYTIDWSPNYIRWYIDGQLVRQFTANSSYDSTVKDYIFPVDPLGLRLGIWDDSANPGWTCGAIDWKKYATSGLHIQIDQIQISCPYGGQPIDTMSKVVNKTASTPTVAAPVTKPTPANAQVSPSPTNSGARGTPALAAGLLLAAVLVLAGMV